MKWFFSSVALLPGVILAFLSAADGHDSFEVFGKVITYSPDPEHPKGQRVDKNFWHQTVRCIGDFTPGAHTVILSMDYSADKGFTLKPYSGPSSPGWELVELLMTFGALQEATEEGNRITLQIYPGENTGALEAERTVNELLWGLDAGAEGFESKVDTSFIVVNQALMAKKIKLMEIARGDENPLKKRIIPLRRKRTPVCIPTAEAVVDKDDSTGIRRFPTKKMGDERARILIPPPSPKSGRLADAERQALPSRPSDFYRVAHQPSTAELEKGPPQSEADRNLLLPRSPASARTTSRLASGVENNTSNAGPSGWWPKPALTAKKSSSNDFEDKAQPSHKATRNQPPSPSTTNRRQHWQHAPQHGKMTPMANLLSFNKKETSSIEQAGGETPSTTSSMKKKASQSSTASSEKSANSSLKKSPTGSSTTSSLQKPTTSFLTRILNVFRIRRKKSGKGRGL